MPGSGTVNVALYRIRSKPQPAQAQLWLLNGGPGASGFDLAYLAAVAHQHLHVPPDVVLLDHRGTGESSFLACDSANSAPSAGEYGRLCSAEIRENLGDKLDGFSTTEVAHDLRELIEATAAPGQKVFVYGVSYGSYLAHRLLQIPGAHVDGVITDGNCISSACSADTPGPMRADEPMRAVLDTCKETLDCKQRLGEDPWAFTQTLIAKLAGGHCSATKLAARLPGDIVFNVAIGWARALPATLYRLDRCNGATPTTSKRSTSWTTSSLYLRVARRITQRGSDRPRSRGWDNRRRSR